jgi:hypothetical protein
MRKSIKITIGILIAFAVVFSGITVKNKIVSNKQKAQAAEEAKKAGKLGMTAEVTEIVGNKVKLKVIDTSKNSNKNGKQGGSSNGSNNGGGQDGGFPAGMPSGGAMPAMPAGGMPGGFPGGGSSSSAKSTNKVKKTYTGEEKEMLLPIGVPIIQMVRGTNGKMTTKNVVLKKIQEGTVLQFWYADDEKTVISRIVVSQ